MASDPDLARTTSPPSDAEIDRLRHVADYQFGAEAGTGLFPDPTALTVKRTSSGRIEQVFHRGTRLVSRRTDGRLTLSIAAAERLASALPDRYRVVVGAESRPYVSEGKNAFAKFVRAVDPAVRPGDEVYVTHDETVLGVGTAILSATDMHAFDCGAAVKIRHGCAD